MCSTATLLSREDRVHPSRLWTTSQIASGVIVYAVLPCNSSTNWYYCSSYDLFLHQSSCGYKYKIRYRVIFYFVADNFHNSMTSNVYPLEYICSTVCTCKQAGRGNTCWTVRLVLISPPNRAYCAAASSSGGSRSSAGSNLQPTIRYFYLLKRNPILFQIFSLSI